MLVKAIRNQDGEMRGYEKSEFDCGFLVAESRSGATQVFRHPNGGLFQLRYLRSGNLEAGWVDSIPDDLTIQYGED